YLAMSATQGEAAVEEAVHKYGTSNPAETTPTNSATKKVDNAAAASVKQGAEAAAGAAAPNTSPAPAASPGPTAGSPSLPPQVAAVVKNVPTQTLLKMARQPAPSAASTGR